MNTENLKRSLLLILGIVLGFGGVSACSTIDRDRASGLSTDVSSYIDTGDELALANLLAEIANDRVVYIGETHDRYDHHLNQLAVIQGLHERGVEFAVGLEFFQRPFQHHLDAYVAGEIGEKQLLKQTGYYRNWGYDFRLYRPIMEFARDNRIPLVALNAPSELVNEVSRHGFAGVTEAWKSELPDIELPADRDYERRLRNVFAVHAIPEQRFERFVQVQLLWDEYMAESTATYLHGNPGKNMVVLAGSGHVAFESAIPGRVQRRFPHAYSVLANAGPTAAGTVGVDHLLLAEGDALPVAGKLGLRIRQTGGGVTVKRALLDEPATASETIRPGDLITSIAGEPIRSMEDVRLAMLDRMPGEQIWVELKRFDDGGAGARLTTVIELI